MERQILLDKADVLRQYEGYGYQVAFYLLEDEALALEAAAQALLELMGNEEFFHQPPPVQRQKTKRIFIKHSLAARISRVQEGKMPGESRYGKKKG